MKRRFYFDLLRVVTKVSRQKVNCCVRESVLFDCSWVLVVRCRKRGAYKVGDETKVKEKKVHMESRENYVFQKNKTVLNILFFGIQYFTFGRWVTVNFTIRILHSRS